MGAWGADAFDNDTACDWSDALGRMNDLTLVKSAIARVLDTAGEYLDSDASCQALAACEVGLEVRTTCLRLSTTRPRVASGT
jgi:hypothetical protein